MEERIKETKSPQEGQPASPAAEPSTGSNAMHPIDTVHSAREKHRVGRLIKEMWPAYLIEIFVIILGISITLALEEWRDKSKEKELEAIYKKNLLADIEADLGSLQYASQRTQELLEKGNELLAFINDPSRIVLPAARADSDLEAIIKRPNFSSSDATFSDLKSSGNLHLLRDIRLKNLLFAYYAQAQTIRNVQDAEQQATIIISGPYFFKRFPMGDIRNREALFGAKEMQALATDIEFRNNVLLRIGNRKELLESYKKADSMAVHLTAILSSGGAE
jgi:hypothetical protein